MKKRFKPVSEQKELREKLIGLGENSLRKSYYPELQRQLDNLNERVQLAELVAEIGLGLTEESNLRSSLQRCCDTLERHTDASFVRIWTLDRAGEHLLLQASSGLHTSIEGQHRCLSLKSYPHKVGVIAREQKPFLTNKVSGNPQFHDQAWIEKQGIVAFAGYPLLLQQRLVGVIALFAQQPLSETVLTTLESINDQIAVSIDRFELLEAYKGALTNARESHEKVNGILRSVADALLVIDNQQRVCHMNQAAEDLLGVSLDMVINQPMSQICREGPLLDYLGQIEQFSDPGDDIDLAIFDAARGETRVMQARAALLKGNHPEPERVISLRDVTQDREVARLKSEFISTAAHELRTPLTTISGFAELLCSNRWSAEKQGEFLKLILDKSETLEHIIDDLLDLSRIESGRGLSLNCSEWQLASSLEKIVQSYQMEHDAYRFDLSIHGELGTIYADHGKILQCLDNLLSNAIKYSPVDSQIEISARRYADKLILKVSDQGIGMTEEQRTNCFEKFYRADSSNTAVGGLGLGLSIVRHVVESHRGAINVASEPGHGTTVTLLLPLSAESEACHLDDEGYLANLFRTPSSGDGHSAH